MNQPTDRTTPAEILRRDGATAEAALIPPGAELQPIPLRWGLNDTMWGDDDSVTVMLSGPDGEPYWLELDAERAAVLRQDLADPGPDDEDPAASSAGQAPATNHTDLRAALDGLHTLIATSSRDWGTYRVDAWIWAVLCGWDCEETEHDDTCTHGALEEMAARHGWGADTVAKARRYRAAVRAVTDGAVLPAPTDRAAVLREAIDVAREEGHRLEEEVGIEAARGARCVAYLLRKRLAKEQPLRRLADETPDTQTTAAEDPARIDRLRPEFFEHASVESIDVQIQRAQRQQRAWGNREQTLTILRQARVMQKEHGESADEGWRGATELATDREIATRAATGLVGYRQGRGTLLHCLAHKPAPASRWADFHEVTAEDLDDGGICVYPRCGRDLLAPWPAAGARQGGEAS